MGPCALIDLIGIDVHVHASEALHETRRRTNGSAGAALRMQEAGTLGRKTGRGFYEY
jgi:3-hydroxybutyryl-CoA dehydrogenase